MLDRETSAGYLANWAARLFARELERQLQPSGIAYAYMPILFALSDGGALTQKELARRAAVEQPTMAATLNRMERDGFIVRRQDPQDRRSALVALTPIGLDKVPALRTIVADINNLALSGMTQEEQQGYYTLIRKVITTLERADKNLGE